PAGEPPAAEDRERGAPHRARRAPAAVAPPEGPLPAQSGRGDGAPGRQGQDDEDEQRLPQLDVDPRLGPRRGAETPFGAPPGPEAASGKRRARRDALRNRL